MDEKLQHLAHHIVEKISKEVRKESKKNFIKFGKTVGIGAAGSPTSYIDIVAENVALKILEKSDTAVDLSPIQGIGKYFFLKITFDFLRIVPTTVSFDNWAPIRVRILGCGAPSSLSSNLPQEPPGITPVGQLNSETIMVETNQN